MTNIKTTNNGGVAQRIFISYGHDEYSIFASKLAESLKSFGYDVFIDTEGIRQGEQWEINIEDGLKWTSEGNEKGIFLLMMTPYSVRRPDGYCLNEIAYALDIELKIVPVMLKQVTPPLSIYRLQYFDLPVNVSASDCEIDNYIEKIVDILKQPELLDVTGNFKKLESSLNPIGFNSELQLFSHNFVGREWVFKYIQEWLSHDNKILMIIGMPGIGKTAISTYLYQRMSNVLGFYMFRRNDNEKLSPKRFVTTLAFQIASQIPDYRSQILHMDIENATKQYNETSLFSHLIAEPLSSIIPPQEDKVIIIDGLDEAEQDGVNHMAVFIKSCVSYLPNWLKIIILSRPIATSLLSFSGADHMEIDATSNDNQRDLDMYVKATLGNVSEERLSEIIVHSEGSFLYVKHLCQNLKNGGNSMTLPMGMTSFYFNAFSEMFTPDQFVEVRKYIELILSSTRPLSRKMLKLVTKGSSYELNDFINKMGAFLHMSSDGTVKLYHTSLSDWLMDEEKAGRFWIDTEVGADNLIEFLSVQIDRSLGTATSLEEVKQYKEETEKRLGMEMDETICPLYLELLDKYNSWEMFIKFVCMYLAGHSFYNVIKEQISNIIDRNYLSLRKISSFDKLVEAFTNLFGRRVTDLMVCSRDADPYELTHYMAMLGYDCRDFIHVEYSSEWLTTLCAILHQAFPVPQIYILPSGFSHEDGICGCFADEIRELLYDIQRSRKVKDQELLTWMGSVALPHDE